MRFKLTEDITAENTLSELVRWYYTVVAPQTLKEHTIYNNRNLLQIYVLPYIGEMRLCDISVIRLDNLFAALINEGALTEGRRLSSATIRQIRMALSAVFTTAVRKGILEKNPVTASTKIRTEPKERLFLDLDSCRQVIRMCDRLPNEQVGRAIKLLLFTGLRRGELVGLYWEDIDFEKAELTVRRTLYRIGKENVLDSPKTPSSHRVIPLNSMSLLILKEQKEEVERLREAAGKDWITTRSVFTGRKGGFLSGDYLNNCFREMMKSAGMPGLHIHDLRHANASILINEGVPMKIVSEHLGHTSSKVTEDFYTHLFAGSRRITASVMDEALLAHR